MVLCVGRSNEQLNDAGAEGVTTSQEGRAIQFTIISVFKRVRCTETGRMSSASRVALEV
jgi:hypothetical protein